MLGIAGARVIEGELPVAKAHERFDAAGRLVDDALAARLHDHLTALAEAAVPAVAAAA